MILEALTKQDFDFRDPVQVDAGNQGFTEDEIRKLAGPAASAMEPGARGDGDWWKTVWARNRRVPPNIQKIKSEFGYQATPLYTNLITVAQAQNTPLDGFIKAESASYNFHIMRCGVYIVPDGGERFEALKFEVQYHNERASTYGMLPNPQINKLFEVGGKAEIGVDGKAEFGFPQTTLGAATLGGSAKAALDAKFIVSFHYELKAPVVDAFGIGNPFGRWVLHKGDNLRNDVLFYPVVRTPKSVKKLACEFKAYFKINHSDWEHGEFYLKPPRTISVAAG